MCVCGEGGGGGEGLGWSVNGELMDLIQESRRLHNMVTQLHQRHHEFTLKVGFMLSVLVCVCVCVCVRACVQMVNRELVDLRLESRCVHDMVTKLHHCHF